jgi:hypothetical protein
MQSIDKNTGMSSEIKLQDHQLAIQQPDLWQQPLARIAHQDPWSIYRKTQDMR